MEFTFSHLKQKDVINVNDGRNLGRVCDLNFLFPENVIIGITATGSKGFRISRQEIFIPVKQVVRIGDDAVLVKIGDGDKCPPDARPPKSPPKRPPNCPPPCPPAPDFKDRRSYDEYE